MIHERIRRARVFKGYSLDALAQRMGDISKQALCKFENGHALPNSSRILQIAEALDLRPEYFFRADTLALAPLVFRKQLRMPKAQQARLTEAVREHLERYVALEQCFELEALGPAALPLPTFQVDSLADAEAAALQLRQAWQIGEAAIADVCALLEGRGLKIAIVHGPEGFDGACAATTDGKHVMIALNGARPGERMRFTAAHELGHCVMRFGADLPESEIEASCQRFAAALLYPASSVFADFGRQPRSQIHPRELLFAKQQYGLSMAATLRRLKELDLLSEPAYRRCAMLLGRYGWRKQEPQPRPPERPLRFEALVFRGLAEDLFSPSRAAEFLQQPVSALDLSPPRN